MYIKTEEKSMVKPVERYQTINNKIIGKRQISIVLVVLILMFLFCVWKEMRISYVIPYEFDKRFDTPVYSEQEQVMKAIAVSYFVYGCETCSELEGKVSDLLEQHSMGIIIENFGIKRNIKNEPSSALIDTATFIKEQIGDFRFLTSVQNVKSGFYGAAFCDDNNQCIWIAYSGSVTLEDAMSCIALVMNPGFSAQERLAFELYEKVMETQEVGELSYTVMLTGHSLGGALAAMVSSVSDCEAVTINGAIGIAMDKMGDMIKEERREYRITNYMTSPQNGRFSMMDVVQRLMFVGQYKKVRYFVFEEGGLTEDSHSAFSFLRYQKEEEQILEIPCYIEKGMKE